VPKETEEFHNKKASPVNPVNVNQQEVENAN